jgi:hypothetical protein
MKRKKRDKYTHQKDNKKTNTNYSQKLWINILFIDVIID